VTCRRWNRRQGPRTRLTEESASAVFLLEGLAPMPVAEAGAAAAEPAELLERVSPGARITVRAPGDPAGQSGSSSAARLSGPRLP